MIALDNFQEVQRRVAAIRTARDRADGAIAAIRERLGREYGVADRDAATAKLAKLERREQTLGDEYAALKKAFEEKFANQLEGR